MSKDDEYVLGVFLKQEIALKRDEITERAEKLVDNHFKANPKEKLEASQINRFIGITRSSDMPDNPKRFIQSQASKERKGWIEKELNKYLIEEIDIIKSDSTQVLDEALRRLKEYTKEDSATKFNLKEKKEKIRNIALELLREFATDFGIYYLYRRREEHV